MFATGHIGGATSITLGNGTSAVAISGGYYNIGTFAGISINVGNGQSLIALNSLSATSLNVTTGQGFSFLGIGGMIQMPPAPGDTLFLIGPIIYGGAAKLSGPVQITSFGANNTVVINQSTFQNSFNLFDFSGNDTLNDRCGHFQWPVQFADGRNEESHQNRNRDPCFAP
jgi:hypothetical protein